MSLVITIVGAVLLIIGIVLGHYYPNKYWLALILVGIAIMIIGIVILIWPSISSLDLILPHRI